MYQLEAKDLHKTIIAPHLTLEILKGVNLKVKQAESVAILGTSGAGKSTLLGLLAGLDIPTSGSIKLIGKDITQLDEDQRAKWRLGQVAFAFQQFHLLPHLTALENVMLPLELAEHPSPKVEALGLLNKVGLSDRVNNLPLQLSGGEAQRVALARAFVTKPKILFADEPTGSLDTDTGNNIIDLLFTLNEENQTSLVFVTHDDFLASRCNREYELKQGILHDR